MIVSPLNSISIDKDKRLDASFYLNLDAINSRKIESNRNRCLLLSELANVFNPPIFKRQFCKKTDKSVPYCQSSDINFRFTDIDVFINKAQAEKVGALVKHNQIIITGFGSIGNIKLIDKDSKGYAFANNVCRIEAYNEEHFGYIYAFLASKFGKSQLNKNASGSVVRYIESPGIKKTLIPILSKEMISELQLTIGKVSELRRRSSTLLKDAEDLFNQLNNLEYSNELLEDSENHLGIGFKLNIKSMSVPIFKAKTYSQRVRAIMDLWNLKTGIKLKDYVATPFKIGVRGSFKRINDPLVKGADMISQGDLHKVSPKVFKKIIVKQLHSDDVASGNHVLFPAVGNASGEGEIFARPTLSYKTFTGKILSGDIGRYTCKTLEEAAYLYIFLKSKARFRVLRSFVYGTQLRRPNRELVKEINIPCKDQVCIDRVSEKVIRAFDLFAEANSLEENAIKLIENEIELWQN